MRIRPATLAGLLVSLAATIGVSWPLATRLGTHLPVVEPGVKEPYPDQLFTAWILAHDLRALLRDPLGVFETVNFHPFRATLAYSENLLGVAAPLLPLGVFTDDPVVLQNVALLVAMAGGSFGVFLLVRDLGAGAAAAAVAAILWTWTPNTWWNWSQLHVMASHPTPLAWWALVRLVQTRGWRWALVLGLMVAWQVWATLHWGVFLALGLATGGVALLVASPRFRAVLPHAAAAAALASVLCMPLVVQYRSTAAEHDLEDRGFVGMLFPWSAAVPPLDRPLEYLAERAGSGSRIHVIATLAPWIAIALGGAAALARRRTPRVEVALVVAIALGGLANYWYALGTARYLGLPSLYVWLSDSAGLGVVRGPIRATQYFHFAVCVLAGVGLGAVFARVGRASRAAIATLLVALTVVETGWRGVPLAAAPARASAFKSEIARMPAGCALAELPGTVEQGVRALWHSTAHWRPVLNGYGGFFPMRPRHTYQLLNGLPDPETMRFLHEAGVCGLLFRTRDDVSTLMRAARFRLAVERRGEETFVRLPPAPPAAPDPIVPVPAGVRVLDPAPEGAMLVDGERTAVVRRLLDPGSGRATITLDLGAPRTVRGIVLFLGSHWRLHLPEFRVDASLDGERWEMAGAAAVIAPPLASYRRDPADIRQTIRFAPAVARYLRLGPYPRPAGSPWKGLAADWGAAEIGVLSDG
jgi:hypothetical protein